MIRIAQPQIGEEEEQAVLAVLRSGRLAQGPRVAEFEAAFAGFVGAQHAVAVSSGTAALVVALTAHNIGPGDEVIVPAFTFAASANAVLLVGARPVLADIEPAYFTLDAERAESAVTPHTRALLPVHLFGHPCDMTALRQLAQARGLVIIEDACQAIGASWRDSTIGSSGTACFSFYATKSITTGEGGMVVTDDDAVATRARLLRNQGEDVRYRTELLGNNYRMTEIAAALGTAQLAKLGAWNKRRRDNAAWLTKHLADIQTPHEHTNAVHVYQQYTLRVPDGRRDAVRQRLIDHEIEASVYYERCLHQQPLYQELGIGGSFPQAEAAANEALSLPVHPGLTSEDVETVAAQMTAALSPTGARRG